MTVRRVHPKPVARADGAVVWRVRYRLPGRANATSETFPDVESAEDFIDLGQRVGWEAARQARDAQLTDRPHVRTVSEALGRHLTLLSATATPGTVSGYRSMARRTWLDSLGSLPVTAVSTDAVTRWVGWQREQPARGGGTYSRKSISNAKALLHAVLAREVAGGTLAANPVDGVGVPGDQSRKSEPVFLTPEQFARILAAIRPEFRTLIATMYGTGLRWGEVTALAREDLELDETPATVRVRRSWKTGDGKPYLGEPKTRRSRRTVTLPAALVRELREHVEDLAPGDAVFPALRGGPLRTAYFHTWVWGPAITASGVGMRPRVHDLRHSHASNLIRAGISLPVIQRRLGHESITTTIDTYGHLAADSHAGAAEAANLSLAQALPQLEP